MIRTMPVPARRLRDAQPRSGAHRAGRGHGDGAGGTRNIDRNGSTSALPRRSEVVPYGQICGRNLTLTWLIFRKWAVPDVLSERARRLQYRISVAIYLNAPPDPGDVAIGADQYRGTKNPEEGSAIHGFFAPGAIGLEHLM